MKKRGKEEGGGQGESCTMGRSIHTRGGQLKENYNRGGGGGRKRTITFRKQLGDEANAAVIFCRWEGKGGSVCCALLFKWVSHPPLLTLLNNISHSETGQCLHVPVCATARGCCGGISWGLFNIPKSMFGLVLRVKEHSVTAWLSI